MRILCGKILIVFFALGLPEKGVFAILMLMGMKLSLAVLCCTVAAASFGTTLYVSSTAAGGGDGSEANPYTMSEAWKNVKAKDTIQLADGTYVEEAARGDGACFTVRDKSNITFQGNVEHPENVIIDFNGTSNRGFYSPNQPFTVRGITFQNKKTNASRGVIAAGGTINGTALVENCRFVNITTDQTGGDGRMGTVFLGGATADFVFRNCEIKDCSCYVWGAMYLTAGTLTLQHCTVTNCHAKTYNASVIGVNGGSSVTIEDCDFTDVGNEGSATDSNNRSGILHVNSGSTAPIVVRRSRFQQGSLCRARLGGFSAVQAGASLSFEDCEFYDFETGNGWAGLLYFEGAGASASFSRCVVSNATVMTNGGAFGVNANSTTLVLNDCQFTDCRARNQDSTGLGGLVYVASGKSTFNLAMTNCVCETTADCVGAQGYNGGQISVMDITGAHLSIDRCEFRGCRAYNAGGAIFSKAKSGDLTVRNCLFTGCDITKQTSGAACIYTAGTSDVKIENCTFADNLPHGNSSNVSPLSPTSSTAKNYVKNCIFWNNCDQAGEGALRVTSSTGNTVFANCAADVDVDGDATGVTLLSASPFVEEEGKYTLNRSARLCINTGAVLDWMTGEALDLAGNPRVYGNGPDLGAYEYGSHAKIHGFHIFLQ